MEKSLFGYLNGLGAEEGEGLEVWVNPDNPLWEWEVISQDVEPRDDYLCLDTLKELGFIEDSLVLFDAILYENNQVSKRLHKASSEYGSSRGLYNAFINGQLDTNIAKAIHHFYQGKLDAFRFEWMVEFAFHLQDLSNNKFEIHLIYRDDGEAGPVAAWVDGLYLMTSMTKECTIDDAVDLASTLYDCECYSERK